MSQDCEATEGLPSIVIYWLQLISCCGNRHLTGILKEVVIRNYRLKLYVPWLNSCNRIITKEMTLNQ